MRETGSSAVPPPGRAARAERSGGWRVVVKNVADAGMDFAGWDRETLHGLPCRILLPRGYDPRQRYPLVLSLHGSGERGDDNERQLKNGLQRFEEPWLRAHAPIVVAPQIPQGATFGGSWYGGASPHQQVVVDIVNDLAARASVDEDRVYGVGFSMGAIGLWDIFVRFAGVFAAGVVIAGDVDVDAATALQGFPLWAVHGSDDALVPPDNTRRVDGVLTAPFRYTEIRGAGHGVWSHAFSQPALWRWLFSNRRAR